MDKEQIKAIAEKADDYADDYLQSKGEFHPDWHAVRDEYFAEALIESYKAELLKEVGEPVGTFWYEVEDDGYQHERGISVRTEAKIEDGDKLFTFDQVAAAITKATKPLEDQLAAAQEEIKRLKDSVEFWESYSKAKLGDQLSKAEQRYLAWEGGEEWEQLAFQLCADECGEESCNELILEGCPPEPWGDRWLKYESEAKRIIQLVRQYAPDKKAEQRVAEACALYIHSTKGAVGSINMAEAVLSGEWRKFLKEV